MFLVFKNQHSKGAFHALCLVFCLSFFLFLEINFMATQAKVIIKAEDNLTKKAK